MATHLADSGKQVIIAGLDTDYMGRPFSPMPDLLSLAESITKTLAICMRCGNPAKHTQRLVESTDLIVVGAGGNVRGALPALFRAGRAETAFLEFALPNRSAKKDARTAETGQPRRPSNRLYNWYSTDQRSHVHFPQSQPGSGSEPPYSPAASASASPASSAAAAGTARLLCAAAAVLCSAAAPAGATSGRLGLEIRVLFGVVVALIARQCVPVHAVGQGEEGFDGGQ